MTGYDERPHNSLRLDTRTREGPTSDIPAAETPRRLLWVTAIVASVLCIVAFILWGAQGPGLLFDMMIALCT